MKPKKVQSRLGIGYLVAVGSIGFALLIRMTLNASLGNRPLMILFILPILVSANFGGWRSGLLATILAALSTAIIRSPPDFLINPQRPEDKVQWAILWITGTVVCLVVESRSRFRQKVRLAQEKTDSLSTLIDQVVNISGLGIFEINHRTNKVYWSPKMRQICGWGADQPVSDNSFIECVPPEEREAIATAIFRAYDPNGNGLHDSEHRLIRSGREIWIRILSQTYFEGVSPNRKPVRTTGSVIDITARKQSEMALKESEMRFRTLVEHAPEAIVLFDIEKQLFVDANKKAEALFGLSFETLMQRGPVDLSPILQPDGRASSDVAKEKIQEAVQGGTPVFEWTHLNKDGAMIPAEIRLVRLYSGGKILIRGSITDISERKRHEEQLKTSVRAMTRSNAELEQFAYVASHDLRAPLTAIINWVQLLDRLVPPPRSEELGQTLEFIQTNATKAINLVNDLLTMARVNLGSGPLVKIDLNKVVQDVLKNLQQQIRDTSALIQCDPLPVVEGIPTYLESIFNNLIQNALIYRNPSQNPQIHICFKEDADFYEMFVKDNGIGIESGHQEKIFDMFTRLHGEKEYGAGSGIGLAFCKKIVELSGGRLWVNSVFGKGSTFYFTYPKNLKRKA